MRLIGPDNGAVSATAYKELCAALKPLSKDELWKVEKNTYPVEAVPSLEELEQSQFFLDLLFDETFFEAYAPPELRGPIAQALLEFTTSKGLPQMLHWQLYTAGEQG